MYDGKYFLGAIRFNNMIPCSENDVEEIRIKDIKDEKYKILLNKQYKIINYIEKDRIIIKANKIYNKKINKPEDYISKLCCDCSFVNNLYNF